MPECRLIAHSAADEQVTVGEEGFFGPEDPNKNCNPGEPGSSWAAQSGQDFTNNHRSKDIDFTVGACCTCILDTWVSFYSTHACRSW